MAVSYPTASLTRRLKNPACSDAGGVFYVRWKVAGDLSGYLPRFNDGGAVEQEAIQPQADQPTENRGPYVMGKEVRPLQHAAD